MEKTDFFKSLSDNTRLNILMLLITKGELCVCELMACLNLSQPKISRHLALLRSNGLLSDSRKGQWVYYSIHPDLPQWGQEILQIMSKTHNFQDLDTSLTLNPKLSCE